MTTNKVMKKDSDLYCKGQALLSAAHEYWKQYQKDVGVGAIVWLENDNNHFILFTRGEYKSAILDAATRECAGEPVLFEPFVKDEEI